MSTHHGKLGLVVVALSAFLGLWLSASPAMASVPPVHVPEPSTLTLLGAGLAVAIGFVVRNRRK